MGLTSVIFICKNTTILRASQLFCLSIDNEFKDVGMIYDLMCRETLSGNLDGSDFSEPYELLEKSEPFEGIV